MPAPVALCLAWIFEKVAKILKKESSLTVNDLRDGFAQRWFDITAAKDVLGYVPTTSVEQGLKETAKGYMFGKEGSQ
ncbi:hypothetical protein V1525DRAFT_415343 [Lipomyces kononenkoae]|uniref:Uncharacterized protein n=1 Tax=Lipomyces kononenkoae TaxID=34357 RepID=A0ACC3SQ62_LIPKO